LKGVDLGAPEKAIREIGELLRGGELESLPEIQSRCAWILAWLSLAARKSTDPETRLLAKARAVLDNDFENAGIERLAERLGVSYSYLNKLFHRRLGVSPVKYRTASRIALAENLLGDLSISIKELSRRLGYANQLRFSNDFKKNRGLSPKAFRESRC
jgi:AraC-like DNA-binding protein